MEAKPEAILEENLGAT
jgi:hypothetical protein